MTEEVTAWSRLIRWLQKRKLVGRWLLWNSRDLRPEDAGDRLACAIKYVAQNTKLSPAQIVDVIYLAKAIAEAIDEQGQRRETIPISEGENGRKP